MVTVFFPFCVVSVPIRAGRRIEKESLRRKMSKKNSVGCKFSAKYLRNSGKMRTFASVQWNEGLDKSPSFLL